MKVLIAGGGTGGHVFPALAIAEELMERDRNNDILFIGTEKGMEKKLVNKRGFELKFIRSAPIMGKGIWSKIKGAFISFLGLFDSVAIINRFSPDVVVGVGGYVSGPVLISSFILRVPRVICEQNSIPGLTNRLLSHFVQKVFISFECSRKYFPDNKVILSGNPVQKKIAQEMRSASNYPEELCILVLGGSQGARKLNEILPNVLKELKNSKIKVIHQTGEKDYQDVIKEYNRFGLNAEVHDFITDIEKFYKIADVVVARSGAGTVAEICALGIPSILIPFPYATHNHQYYNAKTLQDAGASIFIDEKYLTADYLGTVLKKIMSKEVLEDMSEKAKLCGMPAASGIVVDNIYELVNKNV